MTDSFTQLLRQISAETPWLFPLCLGLMGACVGSFLNVVIYRTPRGISLTDPARSFCPSCKAPIAWYCNIPLLSWWMLRGRCARCRQPISFRYWAVEALTALLFAGLAWYYDIEGLPTQILLCAWAATALAMFAIDCELMIVLPGMALLAAVFGMAAAALSPWLIDPECMQAVDALALGAAGAAAGFALLKGTALLGRLFFGRRQVTFEPGSPWSLHPTDDGDDIVLTLPDGRHLFSELFLENSDRLTLDGATLELGGKKRAEGALVFTQEAIETPNGEVFRLEDWDEAGGTCSALRTNRAAMGSGDAWIALAIGALCGWQGAVFALAAGSVIGLAWALVARIGFGKPLPFGPCMLAAAFLWLFGAREWWNAYVAFASGL